MKEIRMLEEELAELTKPKEVFAKEDKEPIFGAREVSE